MEQFEEFDVYITVTGFNLCPNAKRLLEGDRVVLYREPENQYDKSAISVYSEFGKNGYVANSVKTVRKGTLSARCLNELIDDGATAVVVEGGYYEAICKVLDVYDIDKMILKACDFFNKGEYNAAIPLFLKICENHNSVMLMQYTADCFIKTDEYEKSLDFLRCALEQESDNKTSLMMYATALHKLGRYRDAIEIYNKILKLSENNIVKEAMNECIQLSKNEIKNGD